MPNDEFRDDDRRALLPEFRDLLRRDSFPLSFVDVIGWLLIIGVIWFIFSTGRDSARKYTSKSQPTESSKGILSEPHPHPTVADPLPTSTGNWFANFEPAETAKLAENAARETATKAAEDAEEVLSHVQKAASNPSIWIPTWLNDWFVTAERWLERSSETAKDLSRSWQSWTGSATTEPDPTDSKPNHLEPTRDP